MKSLSSVQLFVTLWTVAYEAPPSMGFSRQECWSELTFPSPGDLPDPGIEPGSPALQADALPSEPPGKPFFFKGAYFWIGVGDTLTGGRVNRSQSSKQYESSSRKPKCYRTHRFTQELQDASLHHMASHLLSHSAITKRNVIDMKREKRKWNPIKCSVKTM